MNEAATRAMNELVAWKASSVRLYCVETSNRYGVSTGTGGSIVLHTSGLSSLGVYSHPEDMDSEPEFQAAWAKVQEAVQGLHDAREAIIQRKAVELANLIHGDKLNGIRALVDQIQGGAES